MSCKTMDFGTMKTLSVNLHLALNASRPSCDRLPSSGIIWTDLTDMMEEVSCSGSSKWRAGTRFCRDRSYLWWIQRHCNASHPHELLFTHHNRQSLEAVMSPNKRESFSFIYLMSLTQHIQSASRWEPCMPSWKDHNAGTHSHMGLKQQTTHFLEAYSN